MDRCCEVIDHRVISSSCQVLIAKILQVLYCHSTITISVKNLQIAFDVGTAWTKNPVEGFVCVHDHGHHLDSIDMAVTVSVVRLEYFPRHISSPLWIRQSTVGQDCCTCVGLETTIGACRLVAHVYTLIRAVHGSLIYDWQSCPDMLYNKTMISCLRINFAFRVIKKLLPKQTIPTTAYYLQSDDGKPLSFWNDIPLDLQGDEASMCIEIPRQTLAKMEVIKEMKHHPIMQDTKINAFNKQLELRYYAQFPTFNYGFLPQTWQQNYREEHGLLGDNDPLDICQLSPYERKFSIGTTFKAKILGSFCLIDQGEIDWKVLLLHREQAKKLNVNTLDEYRKLFPRHIEQIMSWFKNIKTYDRKPQNTIAYNQKIFSKEETIDLITSQHKEWKQLNQDKSDILQAKRTAFLF